MSAADHVVRLDEIADPTAFLTGARIPLHDPKRSTRYEWSADTLLWRDPPLGWWEDVGLGPLQEGIALDCADPAVAAWVDRKVASRVARHQFLWAVLVLTDGFFEVVWGAGHVIGQCGLDHLIAGPVARDSQNLPAARATLLRALFGVKK